MAVTALWFGAPTTHPVSLARRLTAAVLRPGVVEPLDLMVTANGTPNMSVNVREGTAVVPGTEALLDGGSYLLVNDGVLNLAVAAAHATNSRRDLVVARIRDKDASGAVYQASIEIVTGTAAASPVDPATPANSILLARITLPALATTVTSGMITELRPTAKPRPAEQLAPGPNTTTNTAYTALTGGPAVTLHGLIAGDIIAVHLFAAMFNSGASFSAMGFSVAGPSAQAAADDKAISMSGTGSFNLGATFFYTAPLDGSYTFAALCRVGAGTGTFQNRRITARLV